MSKSNAESKARVVVRFRPFNKRESQLGVDDDYVVSISEHQTIEIYSKSGRIKKRAFSFDFVFNHKTAQIYFYENSVQPVIENLFNGFNATIISYGQTGSGKTWTMMGPGYGAGSENPNLWGVIPRSIHQIFEIISSTRYDKNEFKLSISFLEVEKDKINDLLDSKKKNLKVHETPKGTYVKDLTKMYCASPHDILKILNKGENNRTIKATALNPHSSMSHTVFIFNMESTDITYGSKTFSTLYICDISCDVKDESVTALGNCINAVSQKKRHIPFRNSNLTRILKDSISGKASCTVICSCSMHESNHRETIRTLQFGKRAKTIRVKLKKNYVPSKKELMRRTQSMMKQLSESEKKEQQWEKERKALADENQKMLDSVLDSVGKGFRIPQSKLKIDREDKLGKGGFGSVFKGDWTNEQGDEKEVAVKVLGYGFQMGGEEVFKEFSRSLQFRDDNVIRTFGFDDSRRNEIAIVMEKLDGNMHDYVRENVLTLEEKWGILVDMTKGLHYLHSMKPKPFLHRDIKGENFLYKLDEEGDLAGVKVCDFGLAKAVTDGSRQTQVSAAGQGTKLWMAPEAGKGLYSVKSDVFSLGITFWEILFEEYPYDGVDPNHVFYKVGVKGLRPDLNLYEKEMEEEEDEGEEEEKSPEDGFLPKFLKELLRKCWDPVRKNRPSTQDLLVWFEDNEMEVLHETDYGDEYFPPLDIQEKNKEGTTRKSKGRIVQEEGEDNGEETRERSSEEMKKENKELRMKNEELRKKNKCLMEFLEKNQLLKKFLNEN